MHSIERYGIVALLFLVVTVVAVLMWDGSKKKREQQKLAPPTAVAARVESVTGGRTGLPSAEQSKLTLLAESEPGPLYRDPPAQAQPEQALGDTRLEAALPETPGPATRLEGRASAPDSPQRSSTARETPDASEPLTPIEGAPAASQPISSAAAPAAGTRRYSVRSGDTLSEIAQHELGSARRWKEIVAKNPGLDPGRLRVGQELLLPGASGSTSLAANTPARSPARATDSLEKASAKTAPSSSSSTWTVGRGESLWKIAQGSLGTGGRWREIVALNPGLDPDHLTVGVKLKLPGQALAKSPGKSGAAPLVVSAASPAHASRQGGRVK